MTGLQGGPQGFLRQLVGLRIWCANAAIKLSVLQSRDNSEMQFCMTSRSIWPANSFRLQLTLFGHEFNPARERSGRYRRFERWRGRLSTYGGANMNRNDRAIRGLVVGGVLAGCAIGLAGPASAELTDGTYQLTYVADGGPPPRPMVVTSCGDGCKHTQIVGPYNASEFHLQGDTWTAPSADGSLMTIDNNTLAGSANNWAFQLTRIS